MSVQTFTSKDKKDWHKYLNRLTEKDIYFTPEYAEVYERHGEGMATLFIYEEGDTFIYYPFLKRRLSELEHVKSMTDQYGELYDLTTPYGYGGPVTNETDPTLKSVMFQRFSDVFHQYCVKNRIVTEFIRYHPFFQSQAYLPDVDAIHLRNTIHVDVTKSLDEIWRLYDSPNRNRIRKAMKNGLTVIHKPLSDLHEFMRIYYATMDKTKADSYYYFSEDYFKNKENLLGRHAELLEVVYQDRVIFSGIFMVYGDFVHYDLVGSDPDYLDYCPNNFVIDYAAKWAKVHGRKYLHLGGGYSGDDSLYRFKKRFNKEGDLPFYIGKRVHDPDMYALLIQNIPKQKGYFPLYRDPFLQKKEVVV